MKAIVIDRYGEAEPLRPREAPDPEPGNEDLLIRVHAASINPLDWKIRDGQLRYLLRLRFPYTLGCDVAGEVVSTGILAKKFKPGDIVFGSLDPRRGGAFAERAALSVSAAARKPDSLDFAEAASLPIAGCTALQALRDLGGVAPGAKILILGGAGGVGHLAVQIGKILGASVTATCGPGNVEFVRSLGADAVVDYTQDDALARGGRYDMIFDVVGKSSFSACRQALSPGGTYVTTLPGRDFFLWGPVTLIARTVWSRAKQARLVLARTRSEDLAFLGQLADEGRLKPVVSTRLPYGRAEEAFALSKAGHARGKIALVI
jgi:NADPH:quinone reductase-like Zn-dependent oxidoreductase